MHTRLRHELGDLILDRWQVLEVLGVGAFGAVYLGRDADGLERAIKELHVCGEPLATAQALTSFRREAEHLTRLRHPHLPTAEAVDLEGPFEFDPATGLETRTSPPGALHVPARHYLVMDYVAGRSLEELVREAQDELFTADDVLLWVQQIGDALAYLHDQGLVHRDVKPANVLIRAVDRQAVLIDFGLCREAGEVGGYGTVPLSASGRLGTPGYAPPDPVEQENPAPSSDQHALAMTIRRVLTGLDPTRPDELTTLRDSRLIELRGDLENHVAAALDRAIRELAEDRFPTMRAFLAALRDAPVPLAAAARHWLEVTPSQLDLGPVARNQMIDAVVFIRDTRPGVVPAGVAESDSDWLRILPPTSENRAVRLQVVLKVPRRTPPGPYKTRVFVQANDERVSIPVSFEVIEDQPAGSGLRALWARWRDTAGAPDNE